MRPGSTESDAIATGEIDSFLSQCLRSILHDAPLPTWPDQAQGKDESTLSRLAFHGIAPFMSSAAPFPPCWPHSVTHEIRKAAALVSFWEATHRQAIAELIEGFAGARIAAVITKGTALAYSVYPEPFQRRRGDTDIIILSGSRANARKVLAQCGFSPDPAPRPLQEDWHYNSDIGIGHAVDIHWRPNASAAISQLIERGRFLQERVALPALSPMAEGLGPLGNLLLTAINRHSHGAMGYHIGSDKMPATDRLIWALDIFLLTRSFDDRAWDRLVEEAAVTRTSSIVRGGLRFAQHSLGAIIPERVIKGLEEGIGGADVANYFATSSGAKRLWLDFAASKGLIGKARLVLRVMLPSDAFLAERFPNAKGWPRMALHLRRWLEGAAKLARSRA